jgi:hypothetical protein
MSSMDADLVREIIDLYRGSAFLLPDCLNGALVTRAHPPPCQPLQASVPAGA